MDKCVNRFHYRAVLFTSMMSVGVLLSGCVDRPAHTDTTTAKFSPPACIKGEPMAQTTLYFGLNRPQGSAISPAEWQTFVDNDVTNRFKEGLTVIDAKGQWLGNNGRVAKESSKALVLIHKNDKDADIEALRSRYKQQFAQESVMRVDIPVCVDF